jgi:hypothetical protein
LGQPSDFRIHASSSMVNLAQGIILIGLVGAMTLTTALYCMFAVMLCLCLCGVLC